MKQSFGMKIKLIRTLHNKTQTEIAQILGVGKMTICSWEAGKTKIPAEKLQQFLTLTATNYYDFLQTGEK